MLNWMNVLMFGVFWIVLFECKESLVDDIVFVDFLDCGKFVEWF